MLVNLRDVSGLAGGSVPALFRSAGPHGLTARDLAALCAELGLRTIIDLRTDAERELVPWPDPPAGVRVHSVPFGVSSVEPGALAAVSGTAEFGLMYARMARRSAPELVRIVRLLRDGPALVHCAAGKDRTGVVVAVVLSLLGVAAARIVADYALTEAAMPLIRSRVRHPALPEETLGALPEILMRAPAEAMLACLAELGDVRGLLAGHGLTDGDVAALRTAFGL